MRFFYCMVALVLSTMMVCAKPITREQAQKKASAFMAEKRDFRMLVPVTNEKKLNAKRLSRQQGSAVEQYYVFNKGVDEGYVIVSGDDQTIDVLGYCDSGSFDYEQLPPQLQDLLEMYTRQIAAIQEGAPVLKLPANHPKVEQFMFCKWSQGSPYNNLCPLDAASRSVTGCVATAMAQILYYNREKSVTETMADIPAYTTWTKGISVPGISAGAPIDWENMKDTYGSASDLQKQAVAQLMLYCGVSVQMDYTNQSSGAQIYDVETACKKYFGYGNSVKYMNEFSSEDELDQLVYNELAAGRPVYLGGYTGNWSVGHAFLTCGYENQRYYINWGWGGTSDGYYYLTNLTPGNGQGTGGSDDGYSTGRSIVIGFEPENFGEKAMSFNDGAVKTICIQKWDADGDGKLTYNEAAAVTSLGDAFKGKTALKKFPELYYFTGITELNDDAFNGCTNLATIRLPKGLKKIGARALKDCKKLAQVNLPTGVNAIDEEAFAGCTSLTGIELSNEITTVEKGLFRGCSALTTFNLPISVSSIGDEAFASCTKLTSFTVNTYHPAGIIIGASVFGSIDLSKATLHVMQGTKSFFEAAEQWKNFGKIVQTRDISGGQFTTIEAGKTYYIYNVGTGRYLTKGEAYKTQAVVGTEPMRFKAVHPSSKPEGVFYFTSPDTGKNGTYLFRTSTDGNIGQGVKAVFVDGTSLTNAYWSVQQTGDQIYTIQLPSTEAAYVAGEFLGVQTDHASNAAAPTYGAYYDVDYDTHKLNCQWQFVLYDEALTERFAEAQTLEKLLATAIKRKVKCDEEQAVYDNLESTTEELKAAQSSLRKKLKFIEFANANVRTKTLQYFDGDADGEISYKEASDLTDFGWLYYFQNDKTIVTFDELQYFTHVVSIPGNFLQGCSNLESVVVPEGVEKIYYYAFKGCNKLTKINIPEYVNVIGEEAFEGCTGLKEVTISNPNPSSISLGNNVFKNVAQAQCTLYVPFGSKTLYEQADVWKNFGNIVEIRTAHSQPDLSPIVTDKPGYIYNIGTRMMLTMGEAYGTQSIVAQKGRLYQWKHSANMADGVYYLVDKITEKVVFRTSTDDKVGEGVKACFGDGNLSAKAYWKVDSIAPNTYTLQLPTTDADYVANHYLGIDENHASNAGEGCTHGIYWDIAGIVPNSQWAFITEEDYKNAQAVDEVVALLKKYLDKAKAQSIDVNDEQAVYDNAQSTLSELTVALSSVRAKLHFITFNDTKTQSICLENWDADADGELTFEEAAAVTDLGEVFRGASTIKSFEELRYFTSLTEIPANAFRGASALEVLYLPASVKTIGNSAFLSCSVLKNLVILNESELIEFGTCSLLRQSNVFVPAAQLEAYQTNEGWGDQNIIEYTGKPIVSAEAHRLYGRSMASINVKVLGAPILGTPECTCEQLNVTTMPVGTYPITVNIGTITTPGVELREGVFTIEPAVLTVTAKSYTRNINEPNPEFEFTYSGFRNRETEEVLITKPVVSCEATIDSPDGVYEITVSGGEAQNYTFEYKAGTLTVVDPLGISQTKKADSKNQPLYDLQGRKVSMPKRGVYVKGKTKVVVK